MNTLVGKDGRALVTTEMAAYFISRDRRMKPSSFRAWAARHDIRPAAYQPNPNGRQAFALWDLTEVGDARYGTPCTPVDTTST